MIEASQLDFSNISKELLEITFDGVVMVDKKGIIIYISKRYCEFLSIDLKNALGKHVSDVIENTRMHIVVNNGKAELAKLQRIKENYMVANRIPIIESGEVIGAIGTVMFKNIEDINTLHKKLNSMKRELDKYKGRLRQENSTKYSFDDIKGKSKSIEMCKVFANKAACADSSVLLIGESGTGKELFAHAIHRSSNRCHAPFVKVNCAAIPSELLESELFGYEGGAFTGAKREGKMGKFELANGGTIFLDEIGDMPLYMQAKLLRVIQEKEVERIGANKFIKLDLRIVAATNKELESMVKNRSFRGDLYYRLNVMKIEIPPLRDRNGDVELLSKYFIDKLSKQCGKNVRGVSTSAIMSLNQYEWHGNIRELRNVIERAINLVDYGEIIEKQHLPNEIEECSYKEEIKPLLKTIEEAEVYALKDALIFSKGNKSKAAKLLGISRVTLYEKLEKYSILIK
ncbi:sigma-54 interaction domain-containing protein [Clostridium sp. MB05]